MLVYTLFFVVVDVERCSLGFAVLPAVSFAEGFRTFVRVARFQIATRKSSAASLITVILSCMCAQRLGYSRSNSIHT